MSTIRVNNINTKGYMGVQTYMFNSIEECDEYFKNRPGLTCLYKKIHDDKTVTAWEGCKIK